MEAQIQKEKSWFKSNFLYFAPLVIFIIGLFEYSFETSFHFVTILYIYLIGSFEVLFRFFSAVLDSLVFKKPKNSFRKFYTKKIVISAIVILFAMVTYILLFGYNESIRYAVSVGTALSIVSIVHLILIEFLYT